MKSPKSADELLDQYYLTMRSALVETAAAFDRIQRAEGGDQLASDERMTELRDAASLLLEAEPERVTRILERLSERGERA